MILLSQNYDDVLTQTRTWRYKGAVFYRSAIRLIPEV